MSNSKNKYRAYGYFVMAGFFYVAAAFEVLVGTIPSRSGDPGTAFGLFAELHFNRQKQKEIINRKVEFVKF